MCSPCSAFRLAHDALPGYWSIMLKDGEQRLRVSKELIERVRADRAVSLNMIEATLETIARSWEVLKRTDKILADVTVVKEGPPR